MLKKIRHLSTLAAISRTSLAATSRTSPSSSYIHSVTSRNQPTMQQGNGSPLRSPNTGSGYTFARRSSSNTLSPFNTPAPTMAKLTTDERTKLLPSLLVPPHGNGSWSMLADRDALHRSLRFTNFNAAFGFMTRVALLAEKMEHHPEACFGICSA
ncbi:hypothetical protein SmJEL517_g05407 [Synchytrium microbalum]|uniref:4a-hydroxytetrahydrobiopterin dehydratase n=1 Tax=Synchytrium microbalum TaxID=1806994 RepID=A0A507BUG1_9FUNG|nr:uncharacterized protein SmJEL517_g05407 [Synchytrium microbalum]TPX31192.1 hypothetical protein SmJEL517_g05407 [Synchytrium microbalum]